MFVSFYSAWMVFSFNLNYFFYLFFDDVFLFNAVFYDSSFIAFCDRGVEHVSKLSRYFANFGEYFLSSELILTTTADAGVFEWALESSYLALLVLKIFLFTLISLTLGFLHYGGTKATNQLFFLLSSFFWILYSEEEVGGIDDFLLVLFIFTVIFLWAGLGVTWLGSALQSNLTFLSLCFFILVIFVLLIPVATLVRYGLQAVVYIRGATQSTSFFVEFIFDLLGVFIIFTRFVVQHIRFVLIFAAYVEFFEWSFFTSWVNFNTWFQCSILDVANFFNSTHYNASVALYCCSLVLTLLTNIVLFFYYFLHLFIVLIIQSIAYFLVAFWLFFFFYTAFGSWGQDKYFYSLRS